MTVASDFSLALSSSGGLLSVVQIELLADHPDLIPTLGEWHYAEWAYSRPGDTIEARIAELQAACGRQEMPIAFVGLLDGQLVGSAMLVPYDMDNRRQWSPWLAGVFTAPEFRGRGVSTKLCRHVFTHAAALGFPRVYLYTPTAETFYARFGCAVVERTTYRNINVTVMSHDQSVNSSTGNKPEL